LSHKLEGINAVPTIINDEVIASQSALEFSVFQFRRRSTGDKPPDVRIGKSRSYEAVDPGLKPSSGLK
jgi:hypothetical protein